MNKYTFVVLPPQFRATPVAIYNEVEHKKLTESMEIIRIMIMAKDIKEAYEKAMLELQQLISFSFADVPNIDCYLFRLRVIEVRNY